MRILADEDAGDEPDYRFTLANERTFLSYVRTSLGMLAAAVGVVKLLTDVTPALRLAAGAILVAGAISASGMGYLRWRHVEQRMRRGQPLPTATVVPLLAVALVALSVLCAVMLVSTDK